MGYGSNGSSSGDFGQFRDIDDHVASPKRDDQQQQDPTHNVLQRMLKDGSYHSSTESYECSSDDMEVGESSQLLQQDKGPVPAASRRRSCIASITVAVIAICALFSLSSALPHFWDFGNGVGSAQETGADHLDDTYEYIVVGAGPSGIFAATKLARGLLQESPTNPPRVLLLESGTTSQSSVTKALKIHKQKQDRQKSLKQRQPRDMVWHEGTTGARLNKFDIPLMWSGVASSQGRLQVAGLSKKVWSNHHWPIHKTLLARAVGGCGLHNAMIYIRSLPTDMNRWNLTSWDFDTVLNQYRGMETFVDSNWDQPKFWLSSSQQPWRGHTGALRTVPAGPSVDNVAPLFVESCANSGIGLAKTPGFNSPIPSYRLGAGYYEFNIRNGLRDSVAEALLGGHSDKRDAVFTSAQDDDLFVNVAYDDDVTDDDGIDIGDSSDFGEDDDITDVEDGEDLDNSGQGRRRVETIADDGDGTSIPNNLEIRVGATVSRVLTEPRAGNRRLRAVGVEYITTGGGKIKVMLRKHDCRLPKPEVIMAAGAIMTPQLLFNSGIGPNGTVAKVPGVGKNLQDHPVVALSFRLLPNMTQWTPSMYTAGDQLEDYVSSVSELQMEDSNLTQSAREQLHARLGVLGTSGFSAGAFLRSPWVPQGDDSPDIQLTVFPRVLEPHVTKKDREASVRLPSAMLITIALLRPEGRYEVRQTSDHVRSSRVGINPSDENPLTKDLHFSLPTIGLPGNKTEYLTDFDVKRLVWGIKQVRKIHQSPPLSYNTAEEIQPGLGQNLYRFVRDSNLPNSHWVGSAKMGNEDDPMAVLDENLRVRAVDALRVVDGSAIPEIPNGNTHSMITVVSSLCADRIMAERSEILQRKTR